MDRIYLDYNATTPVDDRVLEAMMPFFQRDFGNASSRHEFGTVARRAVNIAREQVADLVDVQPSQVIFVSGGSEANNLFIKGAAGYLKPTQIVVSSIEHPCVTQPAEELARQGWALRKLAVNETGRLDLADLDEALTRPTGIVSVMLANNETGAIQDVAAMAARAREHKAWVHTDAVQAAGKIPVRFGDLNVHAMTLSAHKMYGPKGAGALIVDKRLALRPLIGGGGHEGGLRAGTENVPAIVGFGVACILARGRMEEMAIRLSALRNRLDEGLTAMGATVFSRGIPRVPNTAYFAFPGIDGETLVVQLDREGFAVASGAACSSHKPGPSHVLAAMGVDPELGRGAVRVSLGKDNRPEQVEAFLATVGRVVKDMGRLAAMAT